MKSTNAVRMLGALAQEHRLAIYRVLVKRGPQGHAAGEIAARLGIPAPTLSFHLKALSDAGLIGPRRDGRYLYYSANFARMNELVGFLTENCCGIPGAAGACAPLANKANRARERRRA